MTDQESRIKDLVNWKINASYRIIELEKQVEQLTAMNNRLKEIIEKSIDMNNALARL